VKSPNPTRYTQESSIGHQESRIAQTPHPANSNEPPTTSHESRVTNHESRATLARRLPAEGGSFWREPRANVFYFCRESSTNRPFFVQTNPILSASGGFKTLYSTKAYDKTTLFDPTKNEPKRTQTNPNEPKTNPISGPSGAPKAKTNPNEPKTNPILSASGGFKTLYFTKTYVKNAQFSPQKTNPKRTQTNPNEPKTNPTCRGEAGCEAGTNPTCRGEAGCEAGTNPTCRGEARMAKPEQTQFQPPFLAPGGGA
jgi:hypothetical protein